MEDKELHANKPRQRGIYILPNLFTISSLFAGFYAVVVGMQGDYGSAAIAIFFALLMDSLDGRIARLTRTVTAFGAELDSLCDMVSFGAAPALVAYSWALHSLNKLGWLAAFIYTVSVALRLARFNTQLARADKRYFQGLPCPAGAATIAGLIWFCARYGINPNCGVLQVVAAVVTVVAGVLMVSNIRYRSFKDLNLKKHVRFLTILLLVLVIVMIAIEPATVLFASFLGYALSGPILTLWERRKKRKLKKKAGRFRLHK